MSFAAAIAAAQATARQAAGVDVGYEVGPLGQAGLPQKPLRATIGHTVFELVDGQQGTLQRIESRDFLVDAAALETGLPPYGPPVAGGRVLETVAGTTYVYEINAPGGEPAWRFSDEHRRAYRLHTKLIGTR